MPKPVKKPQNLKKMLDKYMFDGIIRMVSKFTLYKIMCFYKVKDLNWK